MEEKNSAKDLESLHNNKVILLRRERPIGSFDNTGQKSKNGIVNTQLTDVCSLLI